MTDDARPETPPMDRHAPAFPPAERRLTVALAWLVTLGQAGALLAAWLWR